MITTNAQPPRASDPDLATFIEPLANYICANDRPREALALAMAVLFDEVGQTHRAARLHFLTARAARTGL